MASDFDPTYTLDVTPGFDAELRPYYDATIYENRKAGVCGPFAKAEYDNLDDLGAWVSSKGFRQTAPFGPVSANGYASAPLELVR